MLTENLHSLVLQVVLGSDPAQISDCETVFYLVKADHPNFGETPASRPRQALSLAPELGIFHCFVVSHTYKWRIP